MRGDGCPAIRCGGPRHPCRFCRCTHPASRRGGRFRSPGTSDWGASGIRHTGRRRGISNNGARSRTRLAHCVEPEGDSPRCRNRLANGRLGGGWQRRPFQHTRRFDTPVVHISDGRRHRKSRTPGLERNCRRHHFHSCQRCTGRRYCLNDGSGNPQWAGVSRPQSSAAHAGSYADPELAPTAELRPGEDRLTRLSMDDHWRRLPVPVLLRPSVDDSQWRPIPELHHRRCD
jgi:hypothetical protein